MLILGSVKMQSKDSMPNADLQWIFCCESYFLFQQLVTKELCIMCIQTGDYITWYIKPVFSILIDLDAEPIRTLCKTQLDRHGLGWHMGDVHHCELREKVASIVSLYSCIFVVDKSLTRFL